MLKKQIKNTPKIVMQYLRDERTVPPLTQPETQLTPNTYVYTKTTNTTASPVSATNTRNTGESKKPTASTIMASITTLDNSMKLLRQQHQAMSVDVNRSNENFIGIQAKIEEIGELSLESRNTSITARVKAE